MSNVETWGEKKRSNLIKLKTKAYKNHNASGTRISHELFNACTTYDVLFMRDAVEKQITIHCTCKPTNA